MGPRSRLRRTAHDDGFAAVDALVALLILSVTLALCLSGLRTADRLSRLAAETGQATRLAASLRDGDQAQGRLGPLRWILAQGSSNGGVCQRTLIAHSLRDQRVYRFVSARPCG